MERLWAPWRMAYIGDENKDKDAECFFCRAWGDKGNEKEHLVLGRSETCFVMLNRFPYSNAHLMIAPVRHIGNMEDTTHGEGAELWRVAALAKTLLSRALRPDGFNIGINQGKIAGAGVLDHLHVHVVPRWNGDVNFMPVLADIRVIPQALEDTWGQLQPFFTDLQ